MYESTAQLPDSTLQLISGMQPAGLIIRTTASAAPSSVGSSVQQALLQLDKLPMVRVLPLEQLTVDSTARHNFNTLLLTLFSVIALVLAAAGIYAVMCRMQWLRGRMKWASVRLLAPIAVLSCASS